MLLRLLFAIVFGVTGFLLGRELYAHGISLHLTNETAQRAFAIAAPVVGAVIGVLLAPLAQTFFEDELNAVERSIERLAPSELAGGAVGLILGLIVAFLIRSILFEFISSSGRAGSYVAILLYIIISVFVAYWARAGARMQFLSLAPSGIAARGSGSKNHRHLGIRGRPHRRDSGERFFKGPFILPRFILRELSRSPIRAIRCAARAGGAGWRC